MSPVAEVVGEEGMSKGKAGEAFEQGIGGVKQPDQAEGAHFTCVLLQLKLEAGDGGNYGRDRAAALRADRLTWDESLTTSAAKHDAS
jgi:hypothetical protein